MSRGDEAAPSSTARTDGSSSTAGSEGSASSSTEGSDTREELAAQVELLQERNRRLREEYLRSRQRTYRRSTAGLAILGVVGVAGALAFPDSRAVLFALGGTGLFAALLTYVLTPERFVAASVSSAVYEALAADREAIVDELGLEGEPRYVSGDDPRLYVPVSDDSDTVPAPLDRFFVTGDGSERGVAMSPTGEPLLAELRRSLTSELSSSPPLLADQLADGIVESFELADGAEASVDTADGRATVELAGVAYGPGDRLDHPVPSLLGTGFAVGLDTTVTVDVDDADPLIVTCRWNLERDEGETPVEGRSDPRTTTDGVDDDGP